MRCMFFAPFLHELIIFYKALKKIQSILCKLFADMLFDMQFEIAEDVKTLEKRF